MKLTPEQEATNYHTFLHIRKVQELMFKITTELTRRALEHDASKLETPELEGFTQYTKELEALTYDSPSYKESLTKLNTALSHHYARNRHHPEHFEDGVEDMNLIDLMEMLVDWCASSYRQNDGNLRKSLSTAAKRFKISPQLEKIMSNTIDTLEK
jgi:hypothetical protein